MKTSCPACGAWSSLDALIGHEGAHQAVAIAMQLPGGLGKLLVNYLGCFRSPTTKQLPWEKVERLLRELLDGIDQASIERKGRRWPAPMDYWKTALEAVLQARDGGTLATPLPNHNYLYEVIVSMSSRAEARQEAGDIHRDQARAGAAAPAQANHGFAVGQQVIVARGREAGCRGTIEELLPRVALLFPVTMPDGATGAPLTIDYALLQAI